MELAWRLPALKEELTVSDITEGMVKQELSLSALHNILTQLLVILQRAWEVTEARLLDDVSEHGSLQGRAASCWFQEACVKLHCSGYQKISEKADDDNA